MRWHMMMTYFFILLVTLVLMSVYILGVLSENLYNKEKSQIFAKANILADTAVLQVDLNELDRIADDITQPLAGTNIRAIVADSAYTVMFDTNKESELRGKILTADVLKNALGGEQASSIYKNDGDDANSIGVAVPINRDDIVIGAVYLTTSLADVDRTIGYIRTSLFVFSVLISILVGILSLGMSYIVTSPIDEFIAAAKEISKGNFSQRVKVRGHNELAQMAHTMNYMCEELDVLEENRRKFVSDASHELKTPLASIKLISDSLVSTENPSEELVKEFLSDLSEEVDRLTRIIERLLTLTKMDSRQANLKPEPVDVVRLVSMVVKKLAPAADRKKIIIYTDFDDKAREPVMLDRDKITEVVYNIADNAIKYTPENGMVKVSAAATDENVTIKIEDNGPGIPVSEKDKIFERFYRLDDSRARDTGGTGLGLAIAREAVLMHGGTIEVISDGVEGTVFLVILPIKHSE